MTPLFTPLLSLLAAGIIGLAPITAPAATPAPGKSSPHKAAPPAKKEVKPVDIVFWHSMDDALGA